MGVSEVIMGEPPAPAAAAPQPDRAPDDAAPPAASRTMPAGWTVPRRTRIAIRASAAVGCALAAGTVAAFVAPPVLAAAIGALIGLFCHLSMGERSLA